MFSMKGAKCKSCGAPIYWVTMVSDRKMPLDVEQKKVVIHAGKDRWKVETGYESHYTTCGQADLWRRREK